MNGSIRKRGQKSWELSIDLGRDADGKRLRKIVNVKGTKAEAQRKLRELLTTLDKGMPLDMSKATVGEFLGMWLKEYAATKAPTTLEGYREKIRNYVLPAIGQIPLAKVTPHQIQSIYASMIERGLSPRTALHVHRVLREALWLEKTLEESVGGFDEVLADEQREISTVGRNTEGFGGSGGGGAGSGRVGLGKQATGDGGGGGGAGAGEGGVAVPQEPRQASIGGLSEEQIRHRTPEDIPDLVSEDIVAKQLREAALSEDDPALRERLWAEYRLYNDL